MKNEKTKNKKIYDLALVAILAISMTIIIFSESEKTKKEVYETLNPERELIIQERAMNEKRIKAERQENVLKYIEKNISEISETKEVLGGSFYLTSADFVSNNFLIIGYEDGHIDLKAEVEFEYQDKDNIEIKNFREIKE